MVRKLVVVFLSLLFLTACGKDKPEEPEFLVPDGWIGPTAGPNPSMIKPDHGPDGTPFSEDLAN